MHWAPARLAWGLRAACLELGVRIHEWTKALSVRESASGIDVRTPYGTVHAARGILATNCFPPLLKRLKHYVVPGLGMFMNIAELFGVVYLTLKAGGATGRDGYIAIGIVLVWCVLGLVWVLSNPRMRGAKLFSDPRGSGRPAAEELPPPAESAESAEEPTPSSGEVTLEA